jgi:N-acetylmuramoyl-L-alanine amidase
VPDRRAARRIQRPGRVVAVVGAATLLAACAGPADEVRGGVVVPRATPGSTGPVSAPPATSAHEGAALTPTGVVVPILGRDGDDWLVGTPCGRTATLPKLTPVSGTVVLDAGHGGEETGAVGPTGHRESRLNLGVAAAAERALEAAGFTVVPTRTNDYRISIPARAAIVAAVQPRAVVSIHHNAAPSRRAPAPGTEVFHQIAGSSTAESKRLAGLLYEEVTAALGKLDLEEWAANPQPGVKYRRNSEGDDFYGILRRNQGTPTALAELGFVSDRAEERLYADPAGQRMAGLAVARGILRFLTTDDPGSGFVEPTRLADDQRNGGGESNCHDPALRWPSLR